jgi:hypothetical protein
VLATLVVVALVAVAADRIAHVVAQRAVATQVQSAGELSVRPSVSIEGVPFLTQAIAGRYRSVRIEASNVSAGGGRLSRLEVSMDGLHLPVSAAISGSVTEVPVDDLRATVLLSYADLQARLRDRRLTLAPASGGLLRVTGALSVLGRTVSASALSSVALSGTDVVVTARRFEVGAAPADRALTAALGKRLDFTARIGQLPYGLELTGVRLRPDGVVATAAAKDAVLVR